MDYLVDNIKNYLDEEPEKEPVVMAAAINYHNITHDDMKNGDGLRVVLWVAGCEHHCKECQNPITWDEKGGIPLTPWDETEFWTWLQKPWTQGATFSGGDPLHSHNRNKIGEMAKLIKKDYPDKDIWVYTGYELQIENGVFSFVNKAGQTFSLPWLNCIDVLVDGRFDCEIRKKDIAENKKVIWRGSSNQRLIDIQKSIASGIVCLR